MNTPPDMFSWTKRPSLPERAIGESYLTIKGANVEIIPTQIPCMNLSKRKE